jgi:23S rRNA (cytidine2498-2'-O)-methyltransferase
MTIWGACYFAKPDYLYELKAEVRRHGLSVLFEDNERIVTAEPYRDLVWAVQAWRNPKSLPVPSIGKGVKFFRELGRYYWHRTLNHHRRGELILEQLPKRASKESPFHPAQPLPPVTTQKRIEFCLLDENTAIYSDDLLNPMSEFHPLFDALRPAPPSSASHKLFETLIRLQKTPKKDEKCLEVGAAPGGWTRLLVEYSNSVETFDRADLEFSAANFPGLKHRKQDAFKVLPDTHGPVDWIFSDLICEPERLLEWVQTWIQAKACKNFVCTLKFKGDADPAVVEKFLNIPGSKVFHLYSNKHELMWTLS